MMKRRLSTMATGMAILASTPVCASDWGCQVLLCLSNPGGPTEFQECEAPISQLYRELFHCGAMPTCPEANLSDWSVANEITNRSRHPRRCFGLVKVLNAGSEVTINSYP